MAAADDTTILIELLPEQVIILVELLKQKTNANQDMRIKAAYASILRAIQRSYLDQRETDDLAARRPT